MPVPSSKDELKDKKFWLALLAEFTGTLFYVLFGCGTYAKAGASGYGSLSTALAFGLLAGTLLWAFQRTSGGHFNPAVSFGFLVTRRVSLVRGVFYILAQLIGGIIGCLLLKGLTPSTSEYGLLAPSEVAVDQAFGLELFITFLFVFTYFATYDPYRSDLAGSAPLTIGLASVLLHFFALPYTGAGMNPARAFAPAVVTNKFAESHWVYWIGPIVGALVAGFLYEFLFAANACVNKFLHFFRPQYDNDNDFSQPPPPLKRKPKKEKKADPEAPAETPVENGKEGEATEMQENKESS